MKKIDCYLSGKKIWSHEYVHLKTNSSKLVSKHFINHHFMWIEINKKRLTAKEKALLLLQPKIDYLEQTFDDFIFDENSKLVSERRLAGMRRRCKKYVAIINNRSIFISRRIYNLFPENNVINMNE